MKLETAVKTIQKDADFLGLGYAEMLEFIKKSPMAQKQKVLEAYDVVMTYDNA